MQKETKETKEIQVWDLGVRLFHWFLVLNFVISYFSAEIPGFDPVHFWAGYALLALLAFRFVWGFVGTEYARFASFAYSPAEVWQHLREIAAGHPKRYLGHSPAGSAYVFSILALLTLAAVTGLIAQGYYEYEGPLWALGIEPPHGLARFCKHAHEWIVDAMLVLIAGHLVGVAVASIQHRENLVLAMITGRKPCEA